MKGSDCIYKTLYLKWRPLTFDDVISQQHITDILKNQIKNNKTAHAYLFTGSRGIGKTTCARILAKAVNCLNIKAGNPCLKCDICREADKASIPDIVEIDAASNNSVEDIRNLCEFAVYPPEWCKFKIYIIDEIHMLSIPAFNALLKIIEEPPSYVKFILATTEMHKIPATVVSRCQRYEFHIIKQQDIAEKLLYIALHEKITLTESGAALIAKFADGCMRDAISLLDQCSVCAEKIDVAEVSTIANITEREYIYDMLNSIADGDTPKGLLTTAQLYNRGKDLATLCDELVLQFRNIMLLKALPCNAKEIISISTEDMDYLKALSAKIEIPTIISCLNNFQNCRERMTKVMNQRVEFEMTLIKLCSNDFNIYNRMKQLETMILNIQTSMYKTVVDNEHAQTLMYTKPIKAVDLTPCTRWDEILDHLCKIHPSIAVVMEGSKAATIGNVMYIFTPNQFFISLFKGNKDNAISLSKAVYTVLGQKYRITARCTTTVGKNQELATKIIQKAINNSIETAIDNNHIKH